MDMANSKEFDKKNGFIDALDVIGFFSVDEN